MDHTVDLNWRKIKSRSSIVYFAVIAHLYIKVNLFRLIYIHMKDSWAFSGLVGVTTNTKSKYTLTAKIRVIS